MNFLIHVRLIRNIINTIFYNMFLFIMHVVSKDFQSSGKKSVWKKESITVYKRGTMFRRDTPIKIVSKSKMVPKVRIAEVRWEGKGKTSVSRISVNRGVGERHRQSLSENSGATKREELATKIGTL